MAFKTPKHRSEQENVHWLTNIKVVNCGLCSLKEAMDFPISKFKTHLLVEKSDYESMTASPKGTESGKVLGDLESKPIYLLVELMGFASFVKSGTDGKASIFDNLCGNMSKKTMSAKVHLCYRLQGSPTKEVNLKGYCEGRPLRQDVLEVTEDSANDPFSIALDSVEGLDELKAYKDGLENAMEKEMTIRDLVSQDTFKDYFTSQALIIHFSFSVISPGFWASRGEYRRHTFSGSYDVLPYSVNDGDVLALFNNIAAERILGPQSSWDAKRVHTFTNEEFSEARNQGEEPDISFLKHSRKCRQRPSLFV